MRRPEGEARRRPGDRGANYRGVRNRPVGVRQLRQRFLIVCEGAKTEPSYFQGFQVPGDIEVVVLGLGENTDSLVESAIRLSKRDNYDQVWCVFDRDSFPAGAFNRALQLAGAAGLKVAYTNEAFELWYLLHFDYHDAALSRTQYTGKLSERLGRPYVKNDPHMYEHLHPRQGAAIRHAASLRRSYSELNPEQDNPSTTVDLLVTQLNQFARP